MSECKTSPANEAEERAIMEWEASNGSNPTIETKRVIRMSASTTPTVSTDKVIRLGDGATSTAQESEALGGTSMVVEDAGGNGSVAQGNTGTPTVSTVDLIRMSTGPRLTATSGGGPVAEVIGGNPTVSTDKVIRARSGAKPTVIVNTNNVGPMAAKGTARTAGHGRSLRLVSGTSPTVIENTSNVGPMAAKGTARTAGHGRSLRLVSGTSPTVIEKTSNVGPVAEGISGSNADGAPVETHCAEGTANVAFNDRETRATSGATTTVIRRGDAVGGTAVVFHLNTIRVTNNVGPVAQGVGNNPTALMPTEIHCTQGSANVALLDRETRAVNGTSPTVITRGDDVGGAPTAHLLRLVRFAPRRSVAADNGSTPVVAGERLAA